jgi:hypothetical protein
VERVVVLVTMVFSELRQARSSLPSINETKSFSETSTNEGEGGPYDERSVRTVRIENFEGFFPEKIVVSPSQRTRP